jgi:PIN domain nuclease of toxin-antitoxin system
MNYLIDTHILLWSFVNPEQLQKKYSDILLNEDNAIYYSPISLWEISLKYSLGKLELKKKTPEQFFEEVDKSFLLCKQIENIDFVSFYKLPIEHKDPFDRLLIWQAIRNDLFFLSVDNQIEKYKKHGLQC